MHACPAARPPVVRWTRGRVARDWLTAEPRMEAMKLMVLAGLALAAAVVAAGCSRPVTSPTPTATPSSAAATPRPAATPTAPPSPTTSAGLDGTIGTAGSDGLTVRYRDPEGGLKSVRVEDFRR